MIVCHGNVVWPRKFIIIKVREFVTSRRVKQESMGDGGKKYKYGATLDTHGYGQRGDHR